MNKSTVQKQRDAAKVEKLAIDSSCEHLLSTREGRTYLWWLLRIGRVGAQPFTTNALTTAFGCGELNIGQQILAHIIEVNPAGYALMIQEKADDDKNWKELNRPTDTGVFSPEDDQ